MPSVPQEKNTAPYFEPLGWTQRPNSANVPKAAADRLLEPRPATLDAEETEARSVRPRGGLKLSAEG